MATKIKKVIAHDRPKIQFDSSFKETFNAMVKVYSQSLDKLNQVASGKTIKSEYGVCNNSYKLRYITPNDVSTYISNLVKGIESGLFNNRIEDTEMFTVASVKRFIEANGCEPFESSSVLDDANRYVNPKNQTLRDLAFICENDIGNVSIYSRGEMVRRLELMSSDVDTMNKMHFTANIKKIVESLPSIIENSDSFCFENYMCRITFLQFLEEFILFACTLNTISVLQLIGYGDPSVEYSVKQKEDCSDGLVTECCLLKTNDFMIRNRIPFNCNMRDVIVQDMTPNFKDTHDALHFIMRDGRSPISTLINKFASKEANVEGDCAIVGRLFLGTKHHRHHADGERWYTKTGEDCIDSPECINGFKHNVSWLDTITFGNNFLDGNYRRDAVGNNNSHPIINTLDSVYKIFGGNDLKSNEDIANNIVRVACLIRGIISEYNNGTVENYDSTKDILVLLGEIMTRNMLMLYYNNTRVYNVDDNMPDAAAPGFICMESYIMEDAGSTTTATSTTQNKNDDTSKVGVSFTNKSGQELKASAKVKISVVIQKFIQWVRNTMSKFSENFNKNHKKEVEWVKKNMQLNNDIGAAIGKKQFNPKVTNFPDFNIPVKELSTPVLYKLVEKYSNPSESFDMDSFTLQGANIKSSEINKFKALVQDPTKSSEAYVNYVLFGTVEKPAPITGDLTAEKWKELCNDLIKTPDAIAVITKAMSDDLTKASDYLHKKIQKIENMQGEEAEKNKPVLQRCNEINKAVQKVSKLYRTQALNALNSKFYSVNYTIYREIVAGYKQQSNQTSKSTENIKNDEVL